MWRRSAQFAVALVTAVLLAGLQMHSAAGPASGPDDLTVHEWGTFTTVAGDNGEAMPWLPLGGPTDLPCFVHYFRNRSIKLLLPDSGPPLDYEAARAGLKGTVRMETPVLYFYASRPARVDVKVTFRQGLFTEWYPNAAVSQVPAFQNLLLTKNQPQAAIAWKNVNIHPGTSPAFPFEDSPSHYYAARDTDAAPIDVNGQSERFLFYRGVAGFPSPITARLHGDAQIVVKDVSGSGIPSLVLFTKQGQRLGYRVHSSLRDQTVLDLPLLDGNFATLRETLERTLVEQGLYVKEAKAMIETWRNSWFEDGTRVFYIVPTSTVDGVLPLDVEPKPAAVVRVFVGRMEVMTPASVSAVKQAFAENNSLVLQRYGRLLGPISDRLLARAQPAERARILDRLDAALKSYTRQLAHCE